ncbi:Rho termination factor N-terminal domain-containing protein [Pseudoalteromonas carrageenovora]|uniref:Rho termination factor N-terminal domain-containing protein n=1 Tax=Pseudoalteromonas carrageenovora TaxID=227 RepID=UPI002FD2C6BA
MVDHGPQIKNDDQYGTLRDEGMSKQKAARIANSNTHKTAVKGGKASQYEQRTKKQLYDKAKEVGISGRSKMNKQELINALRES